MSTANNIFLGDLVRMGTQALLMGRPTTDSKVLDEVAFRDTNGMSRAEWDARIAQRRTDDEHAEALRDLQGEPPEFELRTKLPPQRTLYARFSMWQLRERKALADLEAKKAEFEVMIAAPAATEGEIRGMVRQAADRLLGRGKAEVSPGARKQLGDTLAEQKLAAEAAAEALPELEHQIERAKRRVDHLSQREDEFLRPAIIEIAEDLGLGQIYLDRLRALREVLDLVSGLANVAGGYGSGLGHMTASVKGERRPVDVESVNMPTLPGSKKSDDYALSPEGRSDAWRQLRQALIMDPYCRADRVVVIPK